jgi:peptide/nickel transport system ATP-binding protein
MLTAVRLPDPARIMDSYPHQLSGGQQQRIVIAMALLSKPALLLLDEPTTALDVTVEAGIVQLVKDLGKRFGTSMIFVSHNLGLILETCDRITVMYSGEAVETASSTICAILIRKGCSARSRFPAPTRIRDR